MTTYNGDSMRMLRYDAGGGSDGKLHSQLEWPKRTKLAHGQTQYVQIILVHGVTNSLYYISWNT